MDPVISLINKLQDIFAKIDASGKEIALPQIVVVGAQSAGKSSLIERIVGRDFLPRGTGIVTRMPLILHLVKCPINDARRDKDVAPPEKDYAMFNDEDTVYTDFEKVRQHIQEITDLKAGTNKGIIDSPIGLRIFSRKAINLSLVDLPGLTNVPVGDQPKNIPEQIRSMIQNYIENENSLILAVTPANTDIATSEPLKLAKDVDPEGNRTIAVLTKLDIMDKGTDAMDVLTGATLPVKLGIIGVVNRSQGDSSKPINEVEADEKEFFKQRYPKIAEQNGCKYLAETLSKILINHVQSVLPSLVDHVRNKIIEYEEYLACLGKEYDKPTEAMIEIIDSFTHTYIGRTFSGQGVKVNNKNEELSPSAEMSIIFHEAYVGELNKIQPLSNHTSETIKHILRSKTGLEPNIFPPSAVFSDFIKEEVEKLFDPSVECAEKIHKKMIDVVEQSDTNGIFARFPRIRNFIRSVIKTLLDERLKWVNSIIEDCVQSHKSYMNTRSPMFEEKYEQIMKKLAEMASKDGNDIDKLDHDSLPETPTETDDESFEHLWSMFGNGEYSRATARIVHLVPAYFGLVRDNVADATTKTIVRNLIIHLHENMRKVLLSKFIELPDKAALFSENPSVISSRTLTIQKLEKYYEARKVLDEISTG